MPTYTAQYPPAHNDTYVKATSAETGGLPYYATDPLLSGLGAFSNNGWLASSPIEQKFNIDLGSAQLIRAITIENFHDNGVSSNIGIDNFVLYGSNTASVLSDTTYASTSNLTSLGTYAAAQRAGPGTPSLAERFLVSNVDTYRYYVLRIADNHGHATYMGFRKIEFETEDGYGVENNIVSVTGTGGFIVGGSADISTVGGVNRVNFTSDGGFVIGGAADITKSSNQTTSGGVVIGGAANILPRRWASISGTVGFGGPIGINQWLNDINGTIGFGSNIEVTQWLNEIKGSIGFSSDINIYQEGSFSTTGIIGFTGSIDITQPKTLSLSGGIGFDGSINISQDEVISITGSFGFSGDINIINQNLFSIVGSIGFNSQMIIEVENSSNYSLSVHNSTRWT